MIDAAQIRAARGLLGWSQAHLAKLTGLTSNSISKIERVEVAPHLETLNKIQQVFEMKGVEFLPRGVQIRPTIIESYEGPGSSKQLIEDIYKTLRDTGGEMLIAHLDEGMAIENLGMHFIEEQIRKRKEAGITHRLLVKEDAKILIPPYDTYRSLPEDYFSEYPLYIYGSKLALLDWDKKSVVIDDNRFADCARKLFDFIWKEAKKVRGANITATKSKKSR